VTTNVLVVLADDERFDFLPYMPNVINRIAVPGREFTQCRCNIGLCQPSRAGLLTGQYATRHGVLGNGLSWIANFDHDHTVGRWVQNAPAGYRTAHIGKYLNLYDPLLPAGWDTWRQIIVNEDAVVADDFNYQIFDGTNTISPTPFLMDYLVSESKAFIDGAGSDPWFLVLAPSAPHAPFSCRPQDVFAWSDVRWRLVVETDVSDKPSWIRDLQQLQQGALDGFQATARAQLREIKELDGAVADIVNHLQGLGQLADTLIIFVSDNGLEYGEHNFPFQGIAKNNSYDVALRVPLVMCGPGVTTGVSDEPVCMGIDVTATILAVTGATALDGNNQPVIQDGVDLRDVINNPQVYASRQLLHQKAGYGDGNPPLSPSPPGVGITTPTRKLWRYVRVHQDGITPYDSTDWYEAYDLDTDPDELSNWANDGTRSTERANLDSALSALIAAHSP
jgi:arylsulfatase A-like enzyme